MTRLLFIFMMLFKYVFMQGSYRVKNFNDLVGFQRFVSCFELFNMIPIISYDLNDVLGFHRFVNI